MIRRSRDAPNAVLTGLMTARSDLSQRNDDESENVDVAYRALRFFLDLKGWSIQLFSQKTRCQAQRSPEKCLTIHPHQFAKWKNGEKVHISFVTAATSLLGFPISYFYLVGEQIERSEAPTAYDDHHEWRLQILLGGISNMDESMIDEVQQAVNRRRREISISQPGDTDRVLEELHRRLNDQIDSLMTTLEELGEFLKQGKGGSHEGQHDS